MTHDKRDLDNDPEIESDVVECSKDRPVWEFVEFCRRAWKPVLRGFKTFFR